MSRMCLNEQIWGDIFCIWLPQNICVRINMIKHVGQRHLSPFYSWTELIKPCGFSPCFQSLWKDKIIRFESSQKANNHNWDFKNLLILQLFPDMCDLPGCQTPCCAGGLLQLLSLKFPQLFLNRESGLCLCSGLLLQHRTALLVLLLGFSQTENSAGEA